MGGPEDRSRPPVPSLGVQGKSGVMFHLITSSLFFYSGGLGLPGRGCGPWSDFPQTLTGPGLPEPSLSSPLRSVLKLSLPRMLGNNMGQGADLRPRGARQPPRKLRFSSFRVLPCCLCCVFLLLPRCWSPDWLWGLLCALPATPPLSALLMVLPCPSLWLSVPSLHLLRVLF